MIMKSFLKHLIAEGSKRWGGFIAISGHISMIHTDWHWVWESATVVLLDSILILGLYFEWKDKQ
jgi:hypothetical protein